MFPQTANVETLVSLRIKQSEEWEQLLKFAHGASDTYILNIGESQTANVETLVSLRIK